jgi:hypothetical protein
MSMMIMIAPETARAARSKVTITVGLGGAKRQFQRGLVPCTFA